MRTVRGFRIERLRSAIDKRACNTHEVHCPPGHTYGGGEHSLICGSWQEALDEANEDMIQPCVDQDCDCQLRGK